MKKVLLTTVAVFALAAPALADNSTSVVNQSNTGNAATVNQTGSLAGGDSTINQSGANNSATVTQSDDGSDFAAVAPPINVSTVDQTGDDNVADVTQDTSTFQLLSKPRRFCNRATPTRQPWCRWMICNRQISSSRVTTISPASAKAILRLPRPIAAMATTRRSCRPVQVTTSPW